MVNLKRFFCNVVVVWILKSAHLVQAQPQWQILSSETFESPTTIGWEQVVLPGGLSAEHRWCSTSRPYAQGGNCALRLGDDAETVTAAVLSQAVDATQYEKLRFNFWFVATSADGYWEKFQVDISHDDGSTWEMGKMFQWNTDFTTLSRPQQGSIEFDAAATGSFSSSTKFRVSMGAGIEGNSDITAGNNDRLYMDNIEISGLATSTTDAPVSSPVNSPTKSPTSTPTSFTATEAPTKAPTESPTKAPADSPTEAPTEAPTNNSMDVVATRENTCPKARTTALPNAHFTLPALGSITHEVSFMAFSEQTFGPENHKVVWAGSDGAATSITAFDVDDSAAICTYELVIGSPLGNNWESMSLGPCGSSGASSCLYLGNMGNNGASGCTASPCTGGVDVVEIYKLPEPDVNAPCPTAAQQVVVLQVDYKHADMPTDRADSDTMFVDFTGDGAASSKGDIYVVTRNDNDGSLARVVKYPASAHETLNPSSPVTPFSVIPVASTMGRQWVGADMSSDGHLVALRDFDYVYFYPRIEGQSVSEALAGEPCLFAAATLNGDVNKNTFETVAMMDSNTMMEASECDSSSDCAVEITLYDLHTLSSGVPEEVGAWQQLSFEDFESGWTHWNSTGANAQLREYPAYARDVRSARLKYLGETAMITLNGVLDATPYDQLMFDFEFILDDFDTTSEDFFVEISNDGGATWREVREFDYMRGYVNDVWYRERRIIDPVLIDFTPDMRFRIRCDASSTGDYVYLDNIDISGRVLDLGENLVTYEPGYLRPPDSRGIKWSRGLQAKVIAEEGSGVLLNGGPARSSAIFHTDADAGACFETPSGGWVYVSNSEDPWSSTSPNRGGVGAIYFDPSGNVIDYQWILSKTNDNCGGGKSPWDTWITCEEDGSVGGVFEVDPLGSYGSTSLDPNHRYGRRTCMGQGGGNFESAAFDGRQFDETLCSGGDLTKCVVDFFVTHDAGRGDVRKYRPKPSVVLNGYTTGNMLSILEDDTPSGQPQYSNCANKREGPIEYLKITTGSGGTSGSFTWTTSRSEGQDSAQANYPYNEGVDVKDGRLYIVSKTTKFLFVFDLDAMTWTKTSTNQGLFSHQPDQIKFITGGTGPGLLYFTEDGGTNCGVHAQTQNGQYLTIFESDGSYYNTETTGLAFSPDKKRMYCAFQGHGHVYEITRQDGLPFDGTFLDVKYHNPAVSARRERRQMLLRG